MLKKGNKLEMVIKFLNLKFLFLIIFLATYTFKHAYSEENYIVTIVNNIPITKVDIYNRAKLISISINQNSKMKNIESYYNQSLQTLINEKVILSAGKKINKNLTSIVSNQANQMLLAEFENSKVKLDQFLKKHSISKSVSGLLYFNKSLCNSLLLFSHKSINLFIFWQKSSIKFIIGLFL